IAAVVAAAENPLGARLSRFFKQKRIEIPVLINPSFWAGTPEHGIHFFILRNPELDVFPVTVDGQGPDGPSDDVLRQEQPLLFQGFGQFRRERSEEHTSELQSHLN